MSTFYCTAGTVHLWDKWSTRMAAFLEQTPPASLVLNGDWGDFSCFEPFADQVEKLVIDNAIKQPGSLACFRNLKVLVLKVRPKGNVPFDAFPNLEAASLTWNGPDMLEVFKRPAIRDVSLQSFGDLDFSALPKNSGVKELYLPRPKSKSFRGIGALKHLEHLRVALASSLLELGGLDDLSNLNYLRLSDAKKVTSCQPLGKLDQLEWLSLADVGSSEEIDILKYMTSLVKLHLGGRPIKLDWDTILSLPRLCELSVYTPREGALEEEIAQHVARQCGKELVKFECSGQRSKNMVINLEMKCS